MRRPVGRPPSSAKRPRAASDRAFPARARERNHRPRARAPRDARVERASRAIPARVER